MIGNAVKHFSKSALLHGSRYSGKQVRLQTTVSVAYGKLQLRQDDCTLQDARNAFIALAKQYHPDSGSVKANGEKFAEYSEAYKIVIKSLKMKGAPDLPEIFEEEEYSIEDILKETIPIAHRKYLTNDGIGYGSPSQRQRQYQAYRMDRASRLVSDYKVQKLQRETEGSKMLTVKEFAKRSKTSHFIDRVVEDLIQESMARGELNDLKGGKIETPTMPHVNQHDYYLNRVLINNGYVPEWVQAKQDIEQSLKTAREILLEEKLRFHTPPHSKISATRWREKQDDFVESIQAINKNIEVFNLITPLPKTQMLTLDEEKELNFVMDMYKNIDFDKSEDNKELTENNSPVKEARSLLTVVKQFLGFSS